MARHQVFQHKLVSCTSAIPHPFCQRHPKDPTPCVTRTRTARRRCIPAPAIAVPAPRLRAHCCHADVRVHARLILDLHNSTIHQNIHIHQHVLRHCPPPSEPLCHNGTTPTPPWPNGTTPTPGWTKAITMHPYAAGQLHSLISIDTTCFLLALQADGFSHSHPLLPLLSHKQAQS